MIEKHGRKFASQAELRRFEAHVPSATEGSRNDHRAIIRALRQIADEQDAATDAFDTRAGSVLLREAADALSALSETAIKVPDAVMEPCVQAFSHYNDGQMDADECVCAMATALQIVTPAPRSAKAAPMPTDDDLEAALRQEYGGTKNTDALLDVVMPLIRANRSSSAPMELPPLHERQALARSKVGLLRRMKEQSGVLTGSDELAVQMLEALEARERWLSTRSATATPVEETEDSKGDWQCKDYADGWITFPTRKAAEKYHQRTGAVLRYIRYYNAALDRTGAGT